MQVARHMTTSELDEIYQMIDNLSPKERQLLVEHITSADQTDAETPQDDVTFTEEELVALLEPKEPLTGRQIAEKGLLGGWKDLGIEDSVEWLKQQRARRRDKYKW